MKLRRVKVDLVFKAHDRSGRSASGRSVTVLLAPR